MSTAAGWGLEISVRYVVVYSGEAGGCVDRGSTGCNKEDAGWVAPISTVSAWAIVGRDNTDDLWKDWGVIELSNVIIILKFINNVYL